MSIEPIRQPSRHGGDPIMRIATMGICAMLGLTALTSLLFAPGELLIAVVGMVPAGGAIFYDQTPGRRTAQSVTAMNFAGVSAVMELAWNNGGTLDAAGELLTNVYVWVVILLGAGMGWIIVWLGRLVAARVVIGLIDRQVAQLKEQQNQLVRDWGRRVLEED
jgi:hypothetical protein